MHAIAVVVNERLRHERGRLAVAVGDVMNDVFQDLHFVRFAH